MELSRYFSKQLQSNKLSEVNKVVLHRFQMKIFSIHRTSEHHQYYLRNLNRVRELLLQFLFALYQNYNGPQPHFHCPLMNFNAQKHTFKEVKHSFDHGVQEVQSWRMMILPKEIRHLLIKVSLIIGSLTTVKNPILVTMTLFKEFCNLN